ncbi:hypothetical protein [Spirillospora sp. CA-128828]|uniref:hypothetical protein n=1 Tax=Spirillospora sp. CA-128828 TaxID=3240033 RepID=UPI003D91171B
MKATFHGDATTTYAEYIDVEHSRTLVAEPGETYDIAPASGHVRELPMPPDDRWTPVKAPAAKKGQD